MTTDITELVQREKFEAWWERTQHNGNAPRFGWSHWRDGEGYKVDDDDSELDGMWSAWKAAGAELVEAMEKAQGMEGYWKTQCRGITDHCEQLQAQIVELESRTVTVKLPDYRNTYKGPFADEVEHQVRLALELFSSAAGIKWEAE
ncbi:hypothetical protein [Klebsiella oxytoca]|uniref:hypothetical protein n=1 Tax=Klebsiella oxytoca TaxID=571 RepID=UPI003A9100A5